MSSEIAQYQDWSMADQYDSQTEGLAAKLEEVNGKPVIGQSVKRKVEANVDTSDADSEDEDDSHETESDNRNVRSRSLIDDEQLAVLKGYYAINPRPKKDVISMIANYINFPSRVVQVTTLDVEIIFCKFLFQVA